MSYMISNIVLRYTQYFIYVRVQLWMWQKDSIHGLLGNLAR